MSHQIHSYTRLTTTEHQPPLTSPEHPERNTMKTDTERVLTVLLALALALLAITAFALDRAQQRYTAAHGIRLNEVANGTQRNAFRRRDVCQQSRLFARWNQSLRRSPNSNRLC